MVDIKEFDTLTRSQIKEEIKQKRKLMGEMVGTLFPSILLDEIYELTDIYTKKVKEKS